MWRWCVLVFVLVIGVECLFYVKGMWVDMTCPVWEILNTTKAIYVRKEDRTAVPYK